MQPFSRLRINILSEDWRKFVEEIGGIIRRACFRQSVFIDACSAIIICSCLENVKLIQHYSYLFLTGSFVSHIFDRNKCLLSFLLIRTYNKNSFFFIYVKKLTCIYSLQFQFSLKNS